MLKRKISILATSFLPLLMYSQTNSTIDSLNKELTIAQTKNQLAQTEYNLRQSHSINSQWIAVLGTLGGGIIGLLSGLLISHNNRKIEREKISSQLKEERMKNMRTAAADLMKKTAEAFHSLTWILWIAKNTPEALKSSLINEHDNKMNKIYAEIAGAQVVMSAYSKKLYEDTEPIVRKLYKYDGQVGRASFDLKDQTKKQKAVTELGNLWKEVYDYSLEVPRKFANSLEIDLPLKNDKPI